MIAGIGAGVAFTEAAQSDRGSAGGVVVREVRKSNLVMVLSTSAGSMGTVWMPQL
jgi:hypothetical protein